MIERHPRAALLLLAAALAAAAPARGGDLEVSPILVELSGAGRTAILQVRNGGLSPMRYQVRAFAWEQKPDGAMELTPTRELVPFPPLLELAPGERRNVRVGTQATAASVERAWRLFVEELPRAETPEGATRVAVLTRVGIPVFLAPAKRVAKAELALLEPAPGRVRAALRNPGSVRLRPAAVTFALVAKDGARLLERPLDAWYVLAGGERIYEVEVPPDVCARAAEAVVTAGLDGGVLEARAADPCRAP